MSFDELKKHLKEVHGLTSTEDLTGKKQMMSHMDGSDWYSSIYQWTLNGGLTFTEYFEAKRGKDDLMRHKA